VQSALNFVKGAVAKKDFLPALTHFHIGHGRILGFNGVIAISSPIPLELEVCPKAIPLIKAINQCGETTKLNLTPTGKLSVTSGKFRSYIECLPAETFPEVFPEGESIEIPDGFLAILGALRPIIAEDASRPWARGILFDGGVARVTNNIILIEKWTGMSFPFPINLPKEAIDEILRIGEEPQTAQVSDRSITFRYPEDRWLRTQLYPADWPNVEQLWGGEHTLSELPEGLWAGIESIMPFLESEGRVYFLEDGIGSSLAPDSGASYAVDVPAGGCFSAAHLALLKPLANKIDFSSYPKPCYFTGDKLRGVISGMRQ